MKVPDTIYLQISPDSDESPEWFDDVTWCEDRINESDVEYVRKKVPPPNYQGRLEREEES